MTMHEIDPMDQGCMHPASYHLTTCDQVTKILNQMYRLGNELAEAWDDDGNRDLESIPLKEGCVRPFAMSLDDWAMEVKALAEDYLL